MFWRRPSALVLVAAPAVAASGLVLSIAAVDRRLWLIQLSAVALAGLLAAVTHRALRGPAGAIAIMLLTVAGVAAPLMRGGPGPHRWAALGPLSLYLAPLLLPSFIAACAATARQRRSADWRVFASILAVSLLLAGQPDASQVLALQAGLIVMCVRDRLDPLRSAATLAAGALITAWAFSRPDPLQPVPYVEGVFALALAHSMPAGLAVMAGALVLTAGLALCSLRGPSWLLALAVYYTVLFACSVAGLTPAPLIGYGAGPVLGFGLLIAVRRSPVGADGP